VILLGDGRPLGRLDWPFTEEALTQELARFLEFWLPTPRDLLGGEAPRFSAEDLSGREVTFADLPRPLLLVFFNPDCPPCWDALPALAEISQEVAVAVLAVVSEAGLAPFHRERFAGFVQARNGRPRFVLIGQDLEVLRLYRVVRTPTYILVDKKGVISWVGDGLIPHAALVQEIRAALGEGD
jgi:thiol-disulfide isomerase/thioredoxin